MIRTISLLAALAGAATCASALEANLYETYTYSDFLSEYRPNEVLTDTDVATRQQAFEANMEHIRTQNKAYLAGKSRWVAVVNHFADWTEQEMSTRFGYDKVAASIARASREPVSARQLSEWAAADLPEQLDWRTKNVVTPPKNQGGCGSCWSFSATETIESAVALATGKLLELAPQNFVSCLKNPDQCGGTGGCEGATAELAFDFTAKKGLALENDYRYSGSDEQCRTNVKPAVYVNATVKLPNNDANVLMQAVAKQGPISISVAAQSWSFYSGGIFDGIGGSGCDVDVDHAVQLVGYGSDTSVDGAGNAYWLVRNSWGASWGEQGYIRLLRSPGNEPCAIDKTPLDGVCGKSGPCKCPETVKYCGTCAVLSDSSYPTGARLAN